jgi:mannose-6-phosphate isomerase-like protein (cupin superfamily)
MGDAHTTDGRAFITRASEIAEVDIRELTVANDQGWSRRLVNSELGSPDVQVAMFRMGPHHHHPRHVHANVGEVYFVLEGRCRMAVGEHAEWVEKNTAVYVPRGVAHHVDTADEGVTLLIIYPEGHRDRVQKEFLECDPQERF